MAPDVVHDVAVPGVRVAAPHAAQHIVVAALERDVEEFTHLGQLGARPDEPLREVCGAGMGVGIAGQGRTRHSLIRCASQTSLAVYTSQSVTKVRKPCTSCAEQTFTLQLANVDASSQRGTHIHTGWGLGVAVETLVMTSSETDWRGLGTGAGLRGRAHLGCDVAKRMRRMPGASCTRRRRSVKVQARRPLPSGASPGRSRPYASTFCPSSVTSLYPASPSTVISLCARPGFGLLAQA